MRTINLDEHPHIELWPGRRLCLWDEDQSTPTIIALPKASMSVLRGSRNDQVMFGTSRQTTTIITSKKDGRAASLASLIAHSERPSEWKPIV